MLVASTASAQSTSTSTPVRSLLYWLDDAEVVEPGGITVSAAARLTALPSGHEIDAPSLFVAAGVAPRVQVAASGYYYSLAYSDGFSSSGRGDTYLMGKVAVISPREHPGGIAVTPLVEILSDDSVAARGGGSRVAWGLPVTFQYTTIKVQYVGSVGYFSRGAAFGSAGVEAFVAQHMIVTGSLYYTKSTKTLASTESLALADHRADLIGGADWLVRPNITVFVNVGRTVSQTDPTSARLMTMFGISLRKTGKSTP
jgi:hypothetical protein